MKQLKDIYQEIIEKGGERKNTYKMYLWNRLWKTAVDKKISQNTEPYKIIDNVLYVLTSSSVWAHELTQLKSEIIEKINQNSANDRIKDIQFKSGSINNEAANQENRAPSIINSEGALVEFNLHKENMQSRGWRECGKCGALHAGSGSECFYCKRERAANKENELCRIIRHAPWLNAKEIKKEVKGVEYAAIERIKRNTISKIREERTAKKLKIFKSMIYEYVMHRAGKHPKEIDEKTIKKYIPKNIYEILEAGEEPRNNGKRKKS
jgi:hypothetical protein